MSNNLLISFSGGRTSAYMTWYILQSLKKDYQKILIVFANTGKERPETLDFINECDVAWNLGIRWVEAVTQPEYGKGVLAREVDYNTASRNGEPFEAMIKKHGIPNQSTPHCTRELKKNAIRAFAKQQGLTQYCTAIGIRADEMDRQSESAKKDGIIYPLIKAGITQKEVSIFWSKQPFDLKIKGYEGNCDLCWKKSAAKLELLTREHPKLKDWWRLMEERYGDYIPPSRQHNDKIITPIRFYRGNRSVDDFTNLTEYTQMDLFEFGCSETCEPF